MFVTVLAADMNHWQVISVCPAVIISQEAKSIPTLCTMSGTASHQPRGATFCTPGSAVNGDNITLHHTAQPSGGTKVARTWYET